MKVYKVYDDEWEQIMGSKQIREFADIYKKKKSQGSAVYIMSKDGHM